MPVVFLCAAPLVVGLAMIACARYRMPAMAIAMTVMGALVCMPLIVPLSSASYAWVPALGWTLSFVVDGLSSLFAMLICGIGAVVVLYTHGYMRECPKKMTTLYGFILAFVGAMLGVVFADDAIVLFVCWELTSVLSFGLVAFWNGRADARAGAWRAIVVTALGGIALLVAIGVAWMETGVWRISEWNAAFASGSAHHSWLLDVALFLAVATKSAQLPFSRWLPGAMAAPTPVSAYLHAATLVKAGVYVLARMGELFGGPMMIGIVGIGVCTAVWGAYGAVRQTDAKRMLAHSTVSQLGVLCMLLGIGGLAQDGGIAAYAVAMYHLVHHACAKGALFMLVGIVDHAAQTRDVRQLTGVFRRMPAVGVVATVVMAMFVGLPFTSGFASKESLFLLIEAMRTSGATIFLGLCAVLASVGTFVYGVAWIVRLWGVGGSCAVHGDVRAAMWIPPLVLIAWGVVWGVVPQTVTSLVIDPAVHAIASRTFDTSMQWSWWHGVTWALWMTIAVFVLGTIGVVGMARLRAGLALGVRGLRRLRAVGVGCRRTVRMSAARIAYVWAHVPAGRGAGILWLVWVVCVGAALVLTVDVTQMHMRIGDVSVVAMIVVAGIVCAAVAMAVARQRLAIVCSLGAVGLFVSLLYVWLDAPDLALTQLAVETISIAFVLFVLRHYKHPPRARMSALPVLVGVVVTVLSAIALIPRPKTAIDRFTAAQSVPAAEGANVVNVILVDFRGLDTMLEIVVIAVAACSVVAMLRVRAERKREHE
ncbi:MAG: DUF4040 domain-containing protein [Paenibacillaceae bacterium]|nr:DUF4040 domain-containing protein [Paenibacillaceae bacterium]